MQATELIRLVNEAFEKRGTGNYSQALEAFETLEKLSEHSKDISTLRLYQTYCLLDMGRVGDALDRIRSVRGEDLEEPLRAVYEYHFARALHALGQVQDAIAHIENARRMFDSLSEELVDRDIVANAETRLGLMLAESKRCDEALPLLQKVTIHDYDWGYAKLRMGDCYFEAKQYHEAIECYSTIVSSDLKIDPAVRTDALRNIGCCHYWLGEYAKSVNYLTKIKDAYEAYPDLKDRVLSFLASASAQLKASDDQAKKGDW